MNLNQGGLDRGPSHWLAVAPMILAIIASGCDSGKPAVSTSSTEAKVMGKVLIKGEPAKSGTVHFDPSNYRRKSAAVRSAPINPDGTYEITTLIGENTVSIRGRGLGYS